MLRILLSLKEPRDEIVDLLEGHHVDAEYAAAIPTAPAAADPLRRKVASGNYNVVLLEGDASDVAPVKEADPRAEVILVGNDVKDGIDAIKEGAWAHFPLPLDLDRLKGTIDDIADMFDMRRETAHLERQLDSQYAFAGIVARNPKMLEIFSFIRRVAPYFRTITVTGETGTGKEVVARAVHSLSAKPHEPMLVCNCGGFVETLIGSELFGHKQGSFTGAVRDKVGLFEAAGEGTIFLDEIGEMPLSFQPHVLRVLQNGEFRPIGSNRPLSARCRVITATSKDLAAEVRNGTFREDLFYRITRLVINVPPLRERKDDIPLLSRFLLNRANAATGKNIMGISRSAQAALIAHDWPGNVRELENVIEQAAILATEPFIKLEHVPSYLTGPQAGRPAPGVGAMADVIRRHLEATLRACNGNKSEAARRLGLTRRALLRWIAKYSVSS
jgi:two-component system response regulator HydG